MIRFSKKLKYAMVVLFHFEQESSADPVNTHAFSEKYHLPEEYLGKVLQKMAKGKLLDSVQGANGGYRPARPVSELSFGEVARVMEDIRRVPEEASPGLCEASCEFSCGCTVERAFAQVENELYEHLHNLPLGSIMKQANILV